MMIRLAAFFFGGFCSWVIAKTLITAMGPFGALIGMIAWVAIYFGMTRGVEAKEDAEAAEAALEESRLLKPQEKE